MKILTPTTSFRNLYAFGKKCEIDLSLSENPLGCSPQVAMELSNISLKECFDYPDPDSTELKMALSEQLNLDEKTIFIANGSEAIIKLLAELFLSVGDEVIIPELTFPMFGIVSKLAEANVVLSTMTAGLDIDLTDIKSRITSQTKLIFLCNPNNPTGRTLSANDITAFVKSVPVPVIVDEANIEFGGESVIELAGRELVNLIVLRTFSKAFGLAGFRVGFAVASQKITQGLMQISQPFPISAISQRAAAAALADSAFIKKSQQLMKQERKFIANELTKLGLEVIPSQANNLIVKLPFSSTKFVEQLNMQDVSVVDGAGFNLQGVEFIRVSPRLREANERFVEVVRRVICDKKEKFSLKVQAK